MKKILVLLLWCCATSGFAQGTVIFLTRVRADGVDTITVYGGSVVPGTTTPVPVGSYPAAEVNIESGGYNWGGIYARAGLYGGANGSTRDGLVLLAPIVGFRTGIAAGYVDSGADCPRSVPGVPGGALATLQVRVWDCGVAGIDSYESAVALSQTRNVYVGESALLNNITLGNYIAPGPLPPTSPAFLVALNGYQPIVMQMTVADQNAPEPSVIGLGILGAVTGLLVFRRRN